MARLPKWKKLLSFLMVLTCFFYMFGIGGRTDKIWRDTHPGFVRVDGGYQTKNGASCQVIQMAIPCFTQDQVLNMTTMVKSILFHTYQPLKLHLFTTTDNYRGLVSLFTSWQVLQVRTTFHIMRLDELTKNPLEDVIKRLFQQSQYTGKLLVLRPELIFTTDILQIWKNIDTKSYEVLGFLNPHTLPSMGKPKKRPTPAVKQMAFINLHVFKKLCDGGYVRSADGPSFQKRLKTMCPQYSSDEFMTPRRLNLQWNSTIRYSPVINADDVYDYSLRSNPEFPIDFYTQMVKLDGEMFRKLSYRCARAKPPKPTPRPIMWHPLMRIPRKKPTYDECSPFNYYHKLVYRTYPCFRCDDVIAPSNDPHDITLVTQLQLNRIDAMERLLKLWTGPASVAVYGNDDDSLKFKSHILKSKFLSSRKNVSYHVVFKRGKYYPINYVRNVAIKEVRTPYLFVLDVDFICAPDLYEKLKSTLNKLDLSVPRALLVPTFKTLNESYVIAKTKEEFLTQLNRSTVMPYYISSKKSRYLSPHRYHDYAKWKEATMPYKVEYKFGFEPYMVLPAESPILYHEELLERMRDKISYTYEVEKAGHALFVLDDVYIVHIPHPLSISHSWNKDRKFNMCTRRLFEKIVNRIDMKYSVSTSTSMR